LPFSLLVRAFTSTCQPSYRSPNKVIQAKNLAQILLKLILAHLDTFMTKIDNAPASWGGGPEKVTAFGVLSTVNPKTSSIKQPSRIMFEAR